MTACAKLNDAAVDHVLHLGDGRGTVPARGGLLDAMASALVARNNQSASRNASRESWGRKRPGPTCGGVVLARARSFIFKSASR